MTERTEPKPDLMTRKGIASITWDPEEAHAWTRELTIETVNGDYVHAYLSWSEWEGYELSYVDGSVPVGLDWTGHDELYELDELTSKPGTQRVACATTH